MAKFSCHITGCLLDAYKILVYIILEAIDCFALTDKEYMKCFTDGKIMFFHLIDGKLQPKLKRFVTVVGKHHPHQALHLSLL